MIEYKLMCNFCSYESGDGVCSLGISCVLTLVCYFGFVQMGQFYYAMKAFDVLERLDPSPEYWEGKRGACVGIFQLILAGREPRSETKETKTPKNRVN